MESAQRLADLEQRVVAIGAAAGDVSAVDEIKARLDQVADVAETQVGAVLARLDALESRGMEGLSSEGLDQLRAEVSALGSSVATHRATASTSSAVTASPSSWRSRFSSRTFSEYGSRATSYFDWSASRRTISRRSPPTSRVSRAPKLSVGATRR